MLTIRYEFGSNTFSDSNKFDAEKKSQREFDEFDEITQSAYSEHLAQVR